MESEAQRSPSQCSRALELFLYFFKIGFYTFGGGWSIVAQIQQEYVQKKGWITDEELLDITSVGRSLPGLMIGNVSMPNETKGNDYGKSSGSCRPLNGRVSCFRVAWQIV